MVPKGDSHYAGVFTRQRAVSPPDSPHAPFADLFEQFVGADQRMAGEVEMERWIPAHGFTHYRSELRGGLVQRIGASRVTGRQQPLDLTAPLGITAAGLVQKGTSRLTVGDVKSRQKDRAIGLDGANVEAHEISA